MVLCLTYAYVTNVLCFYVTMSSKLMSLKNYVFMALCLKICYSVFKAHILLSHTKASPR